MSDFSTVAQALAAWPSVSPSPSPAGGTAGRLLMAMQRLAQTPSKVGRADLAGLLAQVLHEEALRRPEYSARLSVPEEPGWPDEKMLGAHGLSVTLRAGGRMILQAQPWSPNWLPGAETTPPFDAVFRGRERRVDARVPGDPVWTALFGREEYLSAGQRDAVRSALVMAPGSSLVVVLPTGGGKSFVAHAPALLHAEDGGCTVMVVPTVALALDQERRAREMFADRLGGDRTRRFAYHGGLDDEAKRSMRQRIAAGTQPLVIASPEAVARSLRRPLLECAQRGGLRTLVIDEAHLVAQWGTEFRPEFQVLAGIRRRLIAASPDGAALRTVLLTATLTNEGLRTLRALFGTPELEIVAAVHLRPEPTYWVAAAPDPTTRDAWLLEALRVAPRPLILYTALREEADRWHKTLREQGLRRIGKIHGNTSTSDRERALLDWSDRATDVMVATSAFGLGMDQADVRTVIHACIPETLDRYYQEVGRGGRDGRSSVSILIHTPEDLRVARTLNGERTIGIEKGLARWQTMYNRMQQTSDGDQLTVALDVVPAHLAGDSDANVAWNMRTLNLMARAGLIELSAAAPPIIERQADELETDFEMRRSRAFEQYASSAVVEPTGLAHLDRAVWERRVTAVRQETQRASEQSLDRMIQVVRNAQPTADLLVQAYTLESETIHLVPERVDGCCPVSRADGKTPSGYLVPAPVVATSPRLLLGRRLTGVLPAKTLSLLIGVPGLGTAASKRWRTQLLADLRILVEEGIREIRAPAGWLDLPRYRSLYRSARPRIVFHTPFGRATPELADELMVPRLTILESVDMALDALADLTCSERPADLLFVPEDLPDPKRPDRRLLAVRDHIPLTRLRREMNRWAS